MALEGNEVNFTITNNTEYSKSFYWKIKAIEGAFFEHDFVDLPANALNGWSNFPSVYLGKNQSKTITIELGDDKIIERAKSFEIVITDRFGAEQESIASFSIEDSTKPAISTDTTSKFSLFDIPYYSYLFLATSPGGEAVVDKFKEDFSFADYTYTYEQWTNTRNRVKEAFFLSENSALLQYENPNADNKRNGEIIYATRNSAGTLQEKVGYEALPSLNKYDSHGLVAFSFDDKENLYSIHYATNYDADNSLDKRVHRLAAHNSNGKLLWTKRLDYGQCLDLEYDNNNGLIIARTVNYNGKLFYDHYSSSDGLHNWTVEPYAEFQYGGFGTSKRSIQILDDGTFLASSSGWLNTGNDFSGSYLAKLTIEDGSLTSLLGSVDSDASYSSHELFEDAGRIYLRTSQGVHQVEVDANPIKQKQPIILNPSPSPTPEPQPEPTPDPEPQPVPQPELNPEPQPIPQPENSVNRLYNSAQGRHLFSSNENEIDILTGDGWKNEGVIYYTPEEATAEVFRFYIPTENRHFYTALDSERDMIIGDQNTFSSWEYEGRAFSAYSTSDYPDNAVAVVRYLNQDTGSHVYSTSTYEQSLLDQSSDWINEGIAWFGDPMVATTDLI